ncbi:unnamed protein product [Clonostachys rosea]|uniref:Hydantoinase A/oxoprolinase domain-containing protein n=1 Tax=Bionectria ochroleuca TaxID=29856 RepID=A0ABY6UGP0_BIOOC|nr:unnamed protein product [Clonostachys rosea]
MPASGSILYWENGLFKVGPEIKDWTDYTPQSSGAHPRPASDHKSGSIRAADANLMLGRLPPKHSPLSLDQALDNKIVLQEFTQLADTINRETGRSMTPTGVQMASKRG